MEFNNLLSNKIIFCVMIALLWRGGARFGLIYNASRWSLFYGGLAWCVLAYLAYESRPFRTLFAVVMQLCTPRIPWLENLGWQDRLVVCLLGGAICSRFFSDNSAYFSVITMDYAIIWSKGYHLETITGRTTGLPLVACCYAGSQRQTLKKLKASWAQENRFEI